MNESIYICVIGTCFRCGKLQTLRGGREGTAERRIDLTCSGRDCGKILSFENLGHLKSSYTKTGFSTRVFVVERRGTSVAVYRGDQAAVPVANKDLIYRLVTEAVKQRFGLIYSHDQTSLTGLVAGSRIGLRRYTEMALGFRTDGIDGQNKAVDIVLTWIRGLLLRLYYDDLVYRHKHYGHARLGWLDDNNVVAAAEAYHLFAIALALESKGVELTQSVFAALELPRPNLT